MATTEKIIEQLRLLKKDLAKRYPIASMALFGSYARSAQGPDSDIDILVELNGRIGSRFVLLAEELEGALQHKVDLVSRRGIKPKYFKAIEKELVYV